MSDDFALRSWLQEKDEYIASRWHDIGEEVYSRKTLVFAAAAELQRRGIRRNHLQLAATDVFVEKGQKLLATRAMWFFRIGGLCAVVAVLILVALGMMVYRTDLDSVLGAETLRELNGHVLTLVIFKLSSAGAFLLAAIYFLTSLARAMLHEGAVLFARRHALRFGRLYVYLREGDIRYKELKEAFEWNKDFSSAFKDIQPDKVTRSMLQRFLDSPSEIGKALGDFLDKFRGRDATDWTRLPGRRDRGKRPRQSK